MIEDEDRRHGASPWKSSAFWAYVRLRLTNTKNQNGAATLRHASGALVLDRTQQARAQVFGLSMVRGLMLQVLVARWEVDGRPNEGTAVSLWLPVPAKSVWRRPVKPPGGGQADGAGRRVVLLDDDHLSSW